MGRLTTVWLCLVKCQTRTERLPASLDGNPGRERGTNWKRELDNTRKSAVCIDKKCPLGKLNRIKSQFLLPAPSSNANKFKCYKVVETQIEPLT